MNSVTVFLLVFLGIFIVAFKSGAQQSDNGNGTYTNPIIWSDFPDNDVIRVGDTYYMVCTTMYFSPGVPILKSKDLVNWEYAANAIPRFNMGPAYNLDGGNRYGHGQWASSIRYHDGKFYILFLTLDEGGFLCTADKAEGPWLLHKLPRAFYDSSLFFDDDGKIYVEQGNTRLSITEVDKNVAPIEKDSIVFNKPIRPGLEGSHMYKINGYYYIYATYGGPDGYQTCLRSKNIYGPYEEKIVLKDDMNQAGRGVHQGALVKTQTGEWWSVIFQDRGGVGRVPTLQPVHWVNNWPIVGENGRAVVTYKKPNVGKLWPVKYLPTSDEFNHHILGLQWAWNHNPYDSCWSLAARKGYLRLTTVKLAANLTLARNTLTQRMFGPYSTATVAMDFGHMKNGDLAGLGVLQLPYALIGVHATGDSKYIVMVNNGKTIDSVPAKGFERIYLEADVNTIADKATFHYSFDNRKFITLGDTLYMKFNLKMFTGNRFVLFNYASEKMGGYVDYDWFRMKTRQGPPNLYNAQQTIKAAFYDRLAIARVVKSEDDNGKDLNVSFQGDSSWIEFDRIKFTHPLKYFRIRYSSQTGGKLLAYIDHDFKKKYADATIKPSEKSQYYTIAVKAKELSGTHSVRIKFSGNKSQSLKLDWIAFSAKQ